MHKRDDPSDFVSPQPEKQYRFRLGTVASATQKAQHDLIALDFFVSFFYLEKNEKML